MLVDTIILYSYVVARDYGFAPNPFGEYCTLATCKPLIRKKAKTGDWVIGTGSSSKKYNMGNQLIYAMRVDETMPFVKYWTDPRFQYKKPVLNGSKKQKYGDNIYYLNKAQNKLVQIDSHHQINEENYNRDTSGKNVLISSYFWYFGENAPQVPEELAPHIIKAGMGYKKIADKNIINNFVAWLESRFETGFNGTPCFFKGKFQRYRGK